jgi:RHS repeat-associated protein
MGTNPVDTFTFYSPGGQKLGVYAVTVEISGGFQIQHTSPMDENYYFAGRLVAKSDGPVWGDRLGSVIGGQTSSMYFPFGENADGSVSGNGKERFATYAREGIGLDYAVNRWYSATLGRFTTVDPLGAKTADATTPNSWNVYNYVLSNPINIVDPLGLCPNGMVEANDNDRASIVSTARTYLDAELTHTKDSSKHFLFNENGNLTSIDCSGLVSQSIAGISYQSSQSFQQASNLFNTTTIGRDLGTSTGYRVGDLMLLPGHVVIVTEVDSNGNPTKFIGSQTSTGPAEVDLLKNSYWAKRVEKFGKPIKSCVPQKQAVVDKQSGAVDKFAEDYSWAMAYTSFYWINVPSTGTSVTSSISCDVN